MVDIQLEKISASAWGTSLVALILHIVSMATTYWAYETGLIGYSNHAGLFSYCNAYGCASFGSLGLTASYKGVQAAVCLAFIANFGAVVTLGLINFVSSLPTSPLKMASVALLAGAALCNAAGVVVYILDAVDVFSGFNVSWSWYVAIVATVTQLSALGVAGKIPTTGVQPV